MSRLVQRARVERQSTSFRRSQTNLDGVMGVRKRDDASSSRTRISTAEFTRAPGRSVDWPAPPPSEWYRRNPELYVD